MNALRVRPLLAAGCFGLVLAIVAGPARAEEASPAPDAEEASYDTAQVQRLSEEAFKAFRDLEFTKARQRLEKALAIAREGEPQSNPVVAKLRLYLGMILFVGFHNSDGAAAQFRVARRLDPGVTPPPGLFNPEVEALFTKTGGQDQPRTNPGGEGPAATPAPGAAPAGSTVASGSSAGPPPPPRGDAPRDDAPAVADEALPPESELLAGRPAAEDAQLPAAPRPLPLALPSRAVADRPVRGPRSRADVADRDDDEDQSKVERPVFVALTVGSGIGVTSAPLDAPGVSPNRAPGRFGFAGGGQVSFALGYFASPSFSLALEGRVQIVSGTSAHCAGDLCDAAPAFAAAGFARASHFFTDGAWRPFGSVGLGGGAIRHPVKLNGLNDCGADHAQSCITTAAGGPLLASLGTGIAYLGDVMMVLAGITANAGAPHLLLGIDLTLTLGIRL